MPDDRFKTTELPVVETEVATELPVIETEVVTETPVVETEKVAAQYPVVPLRTDGLDPNFNYKDFYENGRIDFSPEYFEDIMKLFEGRKKITSEVSGRSYTPLQALATQAAEEFNGQTGMGSYKEFKEGKSKFRPGVKFTDQMILERLTTMEEKTFIVVILFVACSMQVYYLKQSTILLSDCKHNYSYYFIEGRWTIILCTAVPIMTQQHLSSVY